MNNQPIGNFFLREFTGIGEDGLSTYTDLNGDGQIDDSDRISAGSAVPDILYAFYLKFKYKNFDLGLNFNGVSGNKIYNHTRMSLFNKTQISNSLNTTDQAIEENVRLSVTGQNLFVITDYTGFDPELNTGSSSDSKSYGIDYYTYPKARTVVFGLNVSF